MHGSVREINTGKCDIDRIWLLWSLNYLRGTYASGIITEIEGRRMVPNGIIGFQIEGYIYDERELEIIVCAEGYDENGERVYTENDTWSEYIYP